MCKSPDQINAESLLRVAIDNLRSILEHAESSHLLQNVCKLWLETLKKVATPIPMRTVTASVTLLQWAHGSGCPWNENTCALAAENGHLEVLQWARANGCPWDALTCLRAAENGHLEVLQWACDKNCPWDALTCSMAAKNGHLKVLEWARAKGCPCTKRLHALLLS